MYLNIDRFMIRGEPDVLIEDMRSICSRVVMLTESVERFIGILNSKGDSNNSTQYQKALDASGKFIDVLYTNLDELTEAHAYIIEFVDRVNAFNERPPSGARPVAYERRRVSFETSGGVQMMVREDMETIVHEIERIISESVDCCKSIRNTVASMGDFWKDPQFDAFNGQVEGLIRQIANSLRNLDEYRIHLNNIIKTRI